MISPWLDPLILYPAPAVGLSTRSLIIEMSRDTPLLRLPLSTTPPDPYMVMFFEGDIRRGLRDPVAVEVTGLGSRMVGEPVYFDTLVFVEGQAGASELDVLNQRVILRSPGNARRRRVWYQKLDCTVRSINDTTVLSTSRL